MKNQKQKILLHVCCAPCSTSVIERLLVDYDIDLFFSNSNIYPYEEYEKRRDEMKQLADKMALQMYESSYDHDAFLDCVKERDSHNENGPRCIECFWLRLEDTANFCVNNGYDLFTTTMTVSPHKISDLINAIGVDIASIKGIRYLESDFKKKGGFERSVKLSKENGLYRQDYCGCEVSIRRRG